MRLLTQKDVIEVMMGKKLSVKTLTQILSAKYPDADTQLKVVRCRIDSLTHSKHVDIDIFSVKGKSSLYLLKSVSEKFFKGCQVQAGRTRTSNNSRPPFEPREQLAAIRMQQFTRYLAAARAA